MRLETFFEKFELFADAPNAVAKMRELVLELAVKGQLVEQDSNETPSLVSLRGVTRAVRALAVNDDQAVPAGWVSIPLGCAVASNTGGGTPSKQNPAYWNGSIPWASVKDIQSEKFLTTTIDSITEEGLRTSSSNLIPVNRLLVVTRMGLGKLAINKIPVAINQDLRAIEPSDALDLDYAYLLFMALKLIGKGVTVNGVTIEELHSMPVALPPLAEQRRIVAKVDELMALCDRLEAQQRERDTRHAALARASLARFAEAPTPANLDFLFHQSYTITPADLRKTILTLAVQGKLVPQDPNDEPAEVCLSRLGLKSTLVALDGDDDSEGLLPSSWTRVRFEDVALVAGGVTLGRKLGARKTMSLPYLRVANVKRGEVDLGVIKEVSIAEDELERYALRENDLLMTEGGDWDKVGRAAIWRATIPLCLHQNHVFRSRMRSAEIAPEWFERYFNSPAGRGYFESAAKQTTNLASINMRQVRGCPVPLPPLAEQRRIVAKVDQLMALMDQLERHLAESKAKSAALLDAVIHELLNPTAEIIDLASYRAAIGCYAIRKMQGKRYFGRTAAMKAFYLAQAHVGLELGFQPWRDAAGPLDSWIYRFEDEGKERGWFKVVEGATSDGHKKIEYRAGDRLAEQTVLAERQLSESQRQELDRMLKLFADKTTEEVEIIATLFAAWNDFLIDGRTPSDDEIVTEVRENWHVSKARFAPTLLRQWLNWLRQNNLIPQGRSPHTMHQQQLSLN